MSPRSLRLVLPLTLLAVLLVAGTLSFLLSVRERLQDLTLQAEQQVLADVSRLVRLCEDGMGASSTLVAAELAQIASRPPTRAVLVMDEQDRILRAHPGAWRDQQVTAVQPQLGAERLRRAAASRLPDWSLSGDGVALDALLSFELPSARNEVRSSRRGLVYITYDLKDQRDEALRHEALARVPDLLGLIAVFALLSWLLNRHVTTPLARLDRAALALRAGDWAAPMPHGGFQEIAQLAAGLDALRQELSATWHAIPDLLFELDARGRYLRVVAVRPDLLLEAPHDLIGRSIHDVMPPEAAQLVQQALDDAGHSGGVWGRELALEVPAGQRWFEISVARKRLPDQDSPTFMLISRDITERKQSAMQLAGLNEDLEHRVQVRTSELRAAKEEAERANQSKSEFLSRMSHELRTPLNAILGFGQLLSMATSNPTQHGQVQHIVHAGQHLLELINEILDLSRVEAGQMNLSLEPVALVGLLNECLALVRPLADGHQVSIHATIESAASSWRVQADRTRLRQVLINLLSNGVKYNRHPGTLHITLEEGPDTLRVRIADSGMGLREDQLARLFVPFERLGADRGPIEGTGIGLALSKRLMGLMAGQLGVDSQVGVGSQFWLSLPRAANQPVQPASPLHLGAPKRPAHAQNATEASPFLVLCIEDNRLNLQLIEAMLAPCPGLTLFTAADPATGLHLARASQPDLILLDIHLPEMDGHEVIARLKADPQTADIPVVAVTAQAMPEDLQRAQRGGFAAYITKPIDADVLLAEVERWRPGQAYDPCPDTALASTSPGLPSEPSAIGEH